MSFNQHVFGLSNNIPKSKEGEDPGKQEVSAGIESYAKSKIEETDNQLKRIYVANPILGREG